MLGESKAIDIKDALKMEENIVIKTQGFVSGNFKEGDEPGIIVLHVLFSMVGSLS